MKRSKRNDADLNDVTALAHSLSDFADIDGVVVTLCLCVLVEVSWILPSLGKCSVVPNVPRQTKRAEDTNLHF